MIANWFRANKTLLIIVGITSIMFALITSFQVTFLLGRLDDVKTYFETGIITSDLYLYGLIAGLNILIGIGWFVLFFLLVWKILFPNSQTVKNAFCINELAFLMHMPNSLRKELRNKNEQQ